MKPEKIEDNGDVILYALIAVCIGAILGSIIIGIIYFFGKNSTLWM